MNSQAISNFFTILSSILLFSIAAFPLRNYLECLKTRREFNECETWLCGMASKSEYLNKHHLNEEEIICTFCESNKQFKILKKIVDSPPLFGLISNKSQERYQFSSYFCRGCGTELYREKIKHI